MSRLLAVPLLLIAACHPAPPDPTAVSPDEDTRLNTAAASLDNAGAPANTTEQP